MMDKLTFPAILAGFSSKVDGSLTIRFNTQEMDAAEIAEVADCRNCFGWLHFWPNQEVEYDEAPPDNAVRDEGKTPSQRLRDIMYALWRELQCQGLTNQTFEAYYQTQMAKIQEHYKAKIDKVGKK